MANRWVRIDDRDIANFRCVLQVDVSDGSATVI